MKYKNYPKAQERRTGIKVAWLYYAKESDALKASKAAKSNAIIQERNGYDFGYQSPGSINKNQEWFPGLYEVCIP